MSKKNSSKVKCQNIKEFSFTLYSNWNGTVKETTLKQMRKKKRQKYFKRPIHSSWTMNIHLNEMDNRCNWMPFMNERKRWKKKEFLFLLVFLLLFHWCICPSVANGHHCMNFLYISFGFITGNRLKRMKNIYCEMNI